MLKTTPIVDISNDLLYIAYNKYKVDLNTINVDNDYQIGLKFEIKKKYEEM